MTRTSRAPTLTIRNATTGDIDGILDLVHRAYVDLPS